MFDELNIIDTSNLVEKTDYNAKIEDIKDKISSVPNKKISDGKVLVDADYDAKILKMEKILHYF